MMQFRGIYTALITPFAKGKIDDAAFQSFVNWQIEQGVHGLVPCGTTGESPTLTPEEHCHSIELCIEAADGRVPVLAGTGSNATDEAIHFTRHAKDAGADGVLMVSPYYNKPTQEGLYQHYKAVNDAVDIPIIIYNIPGRSVVNITDATLARLAALPNIVGVKDATGDLARVSTLRHKVQDFQQLSGEDMTALAFNAAGGQGCISVSSNVAPALCAKVQSLTLEGRYQEALALHDTLVPLHSAMFCETSPAPVKYALKLMNKCNGELRLPMVPVSEENAETIKQALAELSLL